MKDLIEKINSNLGKFCSDFQYTRKKLIKMGRVPTKKRLFKYRSDQDKEDYQWAINEGGGVEIQYHIALDKNQNLIKYGLGFNTMYVRYNNDKSPVEYVQPFVDSFLANSQHISQLREKGFDYEGDSEKYIDALQDKKYIFIGKTMSISKKDDYYVMSSTDFNEMLENLKGVLFKVYESVLEGVDEQKREEASLQEYISILNNKPQIILQGPPGTGKTYTAKKIAEQLTESKDYRDIIQFHPSYTYEDFVRGIEVTTNKDGQIQYEAKDKTLAKIAKKAAGNADKDFVLIIDEINRANLPSVLGELIYALEYRGEAVETPYTVDGNAELKLPENLYIIGTMNTADRSVGRIDYAIRRRFAFVTMGPDKGVLSGDKAKKLFDKVEKIFENHIAPDFNQEDVQLGHSYFLLGEGHPDLETRKEYEIVPILKEYLQDGVLQEGAKQAIENL